jgi:hypothetical protein
MKKIICLVGVAIVCALAGTVCGAVDPIKTSYTPKEMELRTTMRELFAQLLTWQRAVMFTTIGSSADAIKVRERLMKCQDGIGNICGTYFGEDQGQKLASLLKQYSELIVEYSTCVLMRSDKSPTITKINDKLDEIATFLSQSNMAWDKATLAGKLKRYSDMLNAEMDAQSPTLGAIDIPSFDATFYMGMDIADTITFGIIKQDPGRFW